MDRRPPFVDEHAIEVRAAPHAAWEAAVAVASSDGSSALTSAGVRALGCRHVEVSGPPEAAGSTFPGWRVAESRAPDVYTLEGEHRFSNYRLEFRIDDLGGGRARVRAITRAAFPGAAGRVYRGLVIGTRLHVLAVGRLLRAIERRAEAGSG